MTQSNSNGKTNSAYLNVFTIPSKALPPPDVGSSKTIGDQKDQEEVHVQHTVKRPLQNIWILRYRECNSSKPSDATEHKITSFETIEDFERIQRYIKPPSAIKLGSDYSLLKKGIKPLWENEDIKQGGRWVITFHKRFKEDLDRIWQNLLVGLIHETFDCANEICGAVVSIRGKNNEILIWTADSSKEDALLEIGNKLKVGLDLGRQTIEYQLHRDVMAKKRKSVEPIHTL